MIQRVTDGFIVNINKPEGWTSFDVVRKVRGITRIKKVGHAGTLDPFATGVLLVCLRKATKLTERLMTLPKEYVATLRLGQRTDTLDRTGRVTDTMPIPDLTEAAVTAVLDSFTGQIRQRIPDYSAAKIGGHRRYALARKGKPIPESFKTVEIYEMELLDLRPPLLRFRVLCSRGTYVRTLGADIAEALGTAGFLEELTRTRIGDYSIQDSLTIDEFKKQWDHIRANTDISTY